jgi:D-amino-acid dehydrogenase
MHYDVIVLGAGIVGVSTAIHLTRRGRKVLLVDRKAPGRETSFGNAGIIQREAVRPRSFPRDLATLLRIAGNQGTDARYALSALPALAPPLLRYWWASSPERYGQIVGNYAPLIARSIDEHADLIAAAGLDHLIGKNGWLLSFRNEASLKAELAKAQGDKERFGINFTALSGKALAAREPALKREMAGAIHWSDPWTVSDPGALVTGYAALFAQMGGTMATGDATSLAQSGAEWTVATEGGTAHAKQSVVALGPWSPRVLEPLGYRLPLFVKRGYHMHYRNDGETPLRNWVLDADVGYMLAPMDRGVRITTGAEFAPIDAAPTPVQLAKAEKAARELIALGEAVEDTPWMGARPCTPDMLPIIGKAPRHAGLWIATGHAHHGFTLGPVTGRILAEAMTGDDPVVDMAPYGVERFSR